MSIRAIVFLGAPGAGKGTISEALRQSTGYVHFSTGDMLRDAIKAGSDLGRQAEAFMSRGELVPDKLIVEMVMQRIDAGSQDVKYMFDGFPRTLSQARLLDEGFQTRQAVLEKVFLLDVSRKVALQRLTGRRICRNCGANFHIHNIPPKQNGICDRCGGELYQRPDDTEATILNRLEVFDQQTAALIAYYKSRGILERIDSSRQRDQTVADVMRIIKMAGCGCRQCGKG